MFNNKQEIQVLKSSHADEIRNKNIDIENLKRDIENLKRDNEIVLKRKDAEVDVIVSTKTKKLTEDLAKAVSERDNYKKETEILNKAFENLGFDVKDMKDILNKLVDGIVSKNTIQLVK